MHRRDAVFSRKGRRKMANKNRNRANQPPTGEGKKQSPLLGESRKLNKRSEVAQASNARQNIGTAKEENAATVQPPKRNAQRPKAGR